MSGCNVKPEQMFNLIHGINAYWYANHSEAATAANKTINTTAVPADEIWVLEVAAMHNESKGGCAFTIRIFDSGGDYTTIKRGTGVAQYLPTVVNGPFGLQEGDYIQFVYGGATIGNTMKISARGYKMKLTQ